MMNVPDMARFVCRRLQEAGHEAVVVGGCVRDSLLGREPKDWDVASSASPETVMGLFDRVIPTGLAHGTVTVMVGSEPIEVTTFRSDGDYSDGRRPDSVVLGVSLKEDLSRRDFTMNAMAFDPMSGQLVDPFGGHDSLLNRTVEAVGNAADRFNEDGLRVMRALRFASVLGFDVEDATLSAVEFTKENLRNVSSERVRDELLKLLVGERAGASLDLMRSSGVLSFVVPELEASVGHLQNDHHAFDVWKHTLVTVEHTEGDAFRKLGALLHDVGKPATAEHKECGGFSFHEHEVVGADMAATITERLKLSNEQRDRVVGMVRHHMFGFVPGETSNKALRKLVQRAGAHLLPDLVALRMGDIVGKGTGQDPEERVAGLRERLWDTMHEIVSRGAAVSTRSLAVSGHDVMAELGLSPGPSVGKVLTALLDRVMEEPELNTRESLLRLLPEVDC